MSMFVLEKDTQNLSIPVPTHLPVDCFFIGIVALLIVVVSAAVVAMVVVILDGCVEERGCVTTL